MCVFIFIRSPSPPLPSLPLVTERIHSPFQPKQSPSLEYRMGQPTYSMAPESSAMRYYPGGSNCVSDTPPHPVMNTNQPYTRIYVTVTPNGALRSVRPSEHCLLRVARSHWGDCSFRVTGETLWHLLIIIINMSLQYCAMLWLCLVLLRDLSRRTVHTEDVFPI